MPNKPLSHHTNAELRALLKGTTVKIYFMFFAHVYIDGLFSHAVVGGEKKYPKDLKKTHGILWEPPELTRSELFEAIRDI